jgi:hypothetical protein
MGCHTCSKRAGRFSFLCRDVNICFAVCVNIQAWAVLLSYIYNTIKKELHTGVVDPKLLFFYFFFESESDFHLNFGSGLFMKNTFDLHII